MNSHCNLFQKPEIHCRLTDHMLHKVISLLIAHRLVIISVTTCKSFKAGQILHTQYFLCTFTAKSSVATPMDGCIKLLQCPTSVLRSVHIKEVNEHTQTRSSSCIH